MVAIVGGSGFIGTRLVVRLTRAGVPVRILDKSPSLTFPQLSVMADVRDALGLRAAMEGCTVVVNLAAEHRDDVRPLSLYRDVNVAGARNVCEAATALGIRTIVFTSSVAVYGLPSRETDENAPCRPFNEYGRTKLEAEKVYHDWADAGPARKLTIVRPTAVFGEGNRGNIYRLLGQIANGHFVMVGDGKNKKSLAYVENVAAFLEHCLLCGPNQRVLTVNYVDKPDLDMNALVTQVRALLGKAPRVGLRLPYALAYAGAGMLDGVAWATRRSFSISALRIKKFVSGTAFSSARIADMTFEPPCSIASGLERTVRHEFLSAASGPTYETE